MGKSTSAPQAPNPQQVASAQFGQNAQTAIANARLNNVNQITPWGNLTYFENGPWQDIGGGTMAPSYTAQVTLSPEQQRLYDTQTQLSQGAMDLGNQALNNVRAATAQPFNYNGLPSAPKAPVYDAAFRDKTYNTILQRNQPQMERDRAAFEQRLADQGIGIGDEAYRSGWDQFNRGINDFRLGADLSAQQQAANDYGVMAQTYGLQANQRDRVIQERLNLRNQPINEVAALTGLSSGVTSPQFVNTPQNGTMQAPDIQGAYAQQYAGQMANWQQQQQSQNAMLGGLFGLGSSALMAGMMPGGLFGFGKGKG